MAYELDLPGPPQGQEGDFPNLAHAMDRIAAKAHALWVAYASGAKPLPGGGQIGTRSGTYLRSIQLRQLGPYAWELFSDVPYASAIERGMPARDFTQNVGRSWRARIVKGKGPHQGQRYLIIPFRHGHPGANYGAMPAEVHAAARRLDASRVLRTDWGPSEMVGYDITTHARKTVPRLRTRWGGRLNTPEVQGTRYQGMVRFDKPGGGHSKYLTFRVMGEWSDGWKAPARPGLHPLRAVRDQIQPLAAAATERALAADINLLAARFVRGLG